MTSQQDKEILCPKCQSENTYLVPTPDEYGKVEWYRCLDCKHEWELKETQKKKKKTISSEELVKSSGDRAFVIIIKAMLSGKLTSQQAHKKFDDWFIANGYINTGKDFLGWILTDQIDAMGIYEDEKGVWHYETEMVSIEKKVKNGTIEMMVEVPVKYNKWKRAMDLADEEKRNYSPSEPSEALDLLNNTREMFSKSN